MNILMKHGFGSIVRKFEKFIPLRKKILKSVHEGREISSPTRARYVLEELGPTAIKFGQWMSTRPDVLQIEFVKEFEKLQDRVPPFAFEKVRKIVKEQFEAEIEDLFDYFSEEVIASGSIAQVHKAKLKDGTNVAVKVQRPGIKETIDTDMEILLDLAKFVGDHLIKSEAYDPVAIVDEFMYALEKQLDFWGEAKNIERFWKNFEGVDYVLVPEVKSELTSSQVLTLEYIEGVKINDIAGIEKEGLDKKKIATNITKAYLKQVYVDGFFHGDPHPGNLFVLPYNIIGFTDFGIMGYLDRRAKEGLTKVLMATVRNDANELADAFFEMGIVVGDVDHAAFTLDLGRMLQKYYGSPLKEVYLGDYLNEIMRLMNKHHMRMLPNFALLTVTMWSVEGLVREMDPDFDLFEVSRPFVSQLISQRMNPLFRLKDFGRNIEDYYNFFDAFPRRADRIMTKIEKGDLKIIFRDERLEHLNVVIDKASNRLIVGSLVAAIILGSSLVILSGREPIILGIPILDFSLVLAIVLGVWLILSALRSGRY
jgi:ubiquinone biosynthesis protein